MQQRGKKMKKKSDLCTELIQTVGGAGDRFQVHAEFRLAGPSLLEHPPWNLVFCLTLVTYNNVTVYGHICFMMF